MNQFVRKLLIILTVLVLVLTTRGFTFEQMSAKAENTEAKEIPEHTLRIHYQKEDKNYEDLGLWLWDDVASPTANWPQGAMAFEEEQQDEYGTYIDIPLKEDAKKVSFLVVNRTNGEKEGGDKTVTLSNPALNEIWIKEGSDTVNLFEPVNLPENTVRIHYQRDDQTYDKLGLWLWEDVESPSVNWPTDALAFEKTDRYGSYVDVKVKDDSQKIGFLIVNRENGEKIGGDKGFALLEEYDHLWIKNEDDNVYISPYWETPTDLVSGELLSDKAIQLIFSSTKGLTEEALAKDLSIVDKNQEAIAFDGVKISNETIVEVTGVFDAEKGPFTISYQGRTVTVKSGWKLLDENYFYEGDDLGATYHNGDATLKLWAPKATKVTAVFYDKNDAAKKIGSLDLVQGDKGVWSVEAEAKELGINNVRGYYYQYEVTNDGKISKVLDPYAKSMAAFTVNTEGKVGSDGDTVGKAAIVDLSQTNPANFNSANINGYEKREDAIIWEAHIRDFTSDPTIETDLNGRWGTYKAFIDKLDYIKSLGVTHVQLLPVMAWYWGDETKMGDRELEYSSAGNEYNWGYDPHNYFSPDGAYSENPKDPEQRIKELKELINAIHDAGMGVILDVVYTHMSNASLLNDIVPDYYFFQDSNGKFVGGFGNNLATNHKMAEKLMIDSVKYWFTEFKIDGMRWDMMGDATYEAVQNAYDAAAAINPDALFIGEGWRTFSGQLADSSLAGKGADQDWMDKTDNVGVFSDEMRNELKSGFGSEGEPRFITGGARNIQTIFNNIKAQPSNTPADDPGDIVQYIEAHDNLPLYDIIAKALKKDPSIPANDLEIHKRIRLGNSLILTSQGTAFLHAGQEYGRTKQWLGKGIPEQKYDEFTDENGNAFGYFIHDSYDSSDAINMFDWTKATNKEEYAVNDETVEYTKGLIELRKSTNAFRLGEKSLVNSNVTLIEAKEIQEEDLVIAYKNDSTDNTGSYYVFMNGDTKSRDLTLKEDLTGYKVLVDDDEAGKDAVSEKSGFTLAADKITLDPLTTVVIKNEKETEGNPDNGTTAPTTPETPGDSTDPVTPETPESTTPENPDKENPSGKDENPVNSDKEVNGGNDEKADNDKKDTSDQKSENVLPNTATNNGTYLLIGIIILIAGVSLSFIHRRKKQIH
ncbi:pullulanase [Niallia sp. CLA-SR-H024]|uniref:pullulanase n=1 Tax=Niallia hominis TaxID=3133173 RepID=A0ABV1F6H9_9BACI|nr:MULTISPECIES: pullulanase [Bacillaceae]MCM3364809.1 pullulanase [Niallia sp. MER TA 168]